MRLLAWLSLALLALGCDRVDRESMAPAPAAPSRGTVEKSPPPGGAPQAPAPEQLEDALALAALPAYPNASTARGGFALAQGEDRVTRRLSAGFQTADPPEKVADFYVREAGLKKNVEKARTVVIGKTPNGSDVIMELKPESAGTSVSIRAILYGGR